METEEQIVYQILDVVRAHEINIDEVITEREIRSYLRVHRASMLYSSTFKGHIIPEVCFQSLGEQILALSGSLYGLTLPNIVEFENYDGIELTFLDGRPISVMTKKSYLNHIKIPHMKHLPVAFQQGNNWEVYPGISSDDYPTLKEQIDAFILDPKINGRAVLYNPEDLTTYDWTASPFPFPPEQVRTLKTAILFHEFKISLQQKPDQITNARQDNLRYHDQGKVLE